ncbi:uncharacterized protein CIMG_05381 [Coccidioides immitis RS]|uniref:Mitochondrial carrier protein n=2 Tax=Coccidioides immitis TaxID=5501 RepID=A0A0E1RXL5_COCIM|nr:uncharacterized protein CIMG_05381 [Coccidioides immitis RS]EAS34357.2 hypothetical protein CIMG_05381 [Coccidioides immitis RS]KMU92238.1 hypothetical protein CIHG_10084 [Coccidioides immitis H538.4]
MTSYSENEASLLDVLGHHFIRNFPSSYTVAPFTQSTTVKGPPLPEVGQVTVRALCAAASTAAVYPLLLIATRLKLRNGEPKTEGCSAHHKDGSQRQSGNCCGEITTVVKEIYGEGGLKAFYAGVGEATGKAGAEVFLFFLAYKFFRWRLEGRGLVNSSGLLAVRLLLGIVSEASTKLLTAPIETIITRRQACVKPTRIRDIVIKVFREQGARGLWAGYSASLLLMANPLITLSLNEILLRCLTRRNNQIITHVLSATLSRVITISLTYPILVDKVRRQAGYQKFPTAHSKAIGSEDDLSPASLLRNVAALARLERSSTVYAGITASVVQELVSHGIAAATGATIHAWTIRTYYIYLLLSSQYYSLLDKAKKEIEILAEAAKEEARHAAEQEVASGKGTAAISGTDMYSNETADLVGDYVEDEAAESRSLYHWFWDRDKR